MGKDLFPFLPFHFVHKKKNSFDHFQEPHMGGRLSEVMKNIL